MNDLHLWPGHDPGTDTVDQWWGLAVYGVRVFSEDGLSDW